MHRLESAEPPWAHAPCPLARIADLSARCAKANSYVSAMAPAAEWACDSRCLTGGRQLESMDVHARSAMCCCVCPPPRAHYVVLFCIPGGTPKCWDYPKIVSPCDGGHGTRVLYSVQMRVVELGSHLWRGVIACGLRWILGRCGRRGWRTWRLHPRGGDPRHPCETDRKSVV